MLLYHTLFFTLIKPFCLCKICLAQQFSQTAFLQIALLATIFIVRWQYITLLSFLSYNCFNRQAQRIFPWCLAIDVAISLLISLFNINLPRILKWVTVLINNQAILNVLNCFASNSSQFFVRSITFKFYQLKFWEILCVLQYSLRYFKILRNIQTNGLAKLSSQSIFVLLPFTISLLTYFTVEQNVLIPKPFFDKCQS